MRTAELNEMGRKVACALLLCAGLLLFTLAGCRGAPGNGDVPTFVPPTPRPRQTAEVVRRPLEEWADARGYVSSEREEDLYFPVGGYVKTVEVNSGERVRAGETLAALDAWDLEWTLARAELELQVMELRHRAQENPGPIEEEIYQLQHAYQAHYVERLRERFERTRLIAPFDGVVYSLEVKAGSRVEPYGVVGVLVDPEALVVKALVPDAYRGQVAAGMPVSVTLHVSPSVSWPASVSSVSSRSSAGQGGSYFEALIHFDDRDAVPASYQMACTARVLIRQGPEALFVPAGALTWEGARAYADVLEDGQPARREVVVGRRIEDWVEVQAGVKEGETLLLPAR